MMCPRCVERLRIEPFRHRDYAVCFHCEGVWLAALQLQQHGIDLGGETHGASDRACPSCTDTRLQRRRSRGLWIEVCPDCGGAFFDQDEIEVFFRRYTALDAASVLARGWQNVRAIKGGVREIGQGIRTVLDIISFLQR